MVSFKSKVVGLVWAWIAHCALLSAATITVDLEGGGSYTEIQPTRLFDHEIVHSIPRWTASSRRVFDIRKARDAGAHRLGEAQKSWVVERCRII